MQQGPHNTKTSRDLEARKHIDRLLPTPMIDGEWEMLKKDGYLEDIFEAIESHDAGVVIAGHAQTVADRVMTLRRVYEAAPPSKPQAQVPSDLLSTFSPGEKLSRRKALTTAMFQLAAHDAEITAFVEEVLGDDAGTDSLRMNWIDPVRWIEREWQRERQARTMDDPSLPQPLLKYAPLAFPDASGKMHAQPIRTLPVMQGGTLDRLRLLAERAAIRYGWDPVGAVNFILANVTPAVSTLRARVDWHEDIPALTRITLTIDPTATPAEVVHAYRRVRKKIAQVFPRAMDSKSQWLAVATLSPVGHRALEERMKIWNSNLFWSFGEPEDAAADDPYRSWWYDDPQKFGRDRRRAIQRLLHPKYRYPDDDDLIIGMEIEPEDDLPDDANNDNASDAEGTEGTEGIAEEQDT